jgi:phosphoglycerol transferase
MMGKRMGQKPAKRWAAGVRLVGRVVVDALVIIGAFLIGASIWITQHFGVITIDQAIINLQGAGGEGGGGTALVVNGVVWGALIPIALAVLLLLAIRRTRASNWRKSLPRLARTGVSAVVVLLLAGIPVAGATTISHTLSLPQYVESLNADETLSDYYVTPTVVSEPSTKRNLVIVYMESVEESLTDTSIFEEDMLAPIEKVTKGWASVTLDQPANGPMTIGGIVNTQCGFPLRMANTDLVGNNINVAGQGVATYLPNATCLGDVLKKYGYYSVFMGGANTDFAGKGTFLSDHGYSEVLGLNYWKEQGETEMRSDWGLSDRRFMELAEQKVDELHAKNQPFNLTLLTLDTHPDDTVYPYCDVTTKQELTSIYRCSMDQVASFVTYMKDKGYLDDTVVVVMGDHIRIMDSNNTFKSQLEGISHRTIFNRIWSPDGVDLAVDEMAQFGMYPTILETLGFKLKDGRAGIDVSALEAYPGSGTVRDLSQDEYDAVVLARSQDFYNRVWGVTK